MGIYYIVTQDDVYYELSSTTDIVTTLTGEATEFPLETGESAADHYINKLTSVSFRGTISDVIVLGNSATYRKSTQEYIEGLSSLKESKTPFTINWAGNLSPIPNCVFDSLEIIQNDRRGYSNGVAAYEISFTVKQLRFGEGANILPSVDQNDLDAFSAISGSSGNTKAIAEGSLEQDREEQLSREALIKARQEYRSRLIGGG